MKSWKKYLSIAGVLFVLALTAVVTIPVNAETDETSTIPQRVYFGEVSVGGMTQEEAKEAVEEYISSNLNQTVTLQAGKNTVQVPVSQFGISWGNPEIAEEAAGLGKSGNLIARYKAMKDLENEDKLTGLEGTTTRVHIDGGRVTLLREGNTNSQMVFEEGRRHLSMYETPYGALSIGVNTRRMRSTVDEAGGDLEIDYAIEIDNLVAGQNLFRMNVKKHPPLQQ